ncbi:MAG TPA: SpoIVB peptidase S55 domain-containing protein, partial [Bryobacteraceae bacterium]|nr:SpoIVB peptidase S55 domain-containing protein [Bryobacteraceae bacterium]
MAVFRLFVFLIVSSNLFPQTPIFPLSEVRTGQHGIGKTVFSGSKIEEFQVEILGVLENLGPRQSIILARLSGGPLQNTGVMQGMSGSPVYINGRLVGAVALAFNFAKEPIAGIRPIEEMRAISGTAVSNTAPEPRAALRNVPLSAALVGSENAAASLVEIATPVSFSGFTSGTLERFAPELKKMGMQPRQGISSGGALPSKLGNPAQLRPGDMISVDLLSG